MIEIVHGKMEEVLAGIPENTFDGTFSDPPYGLSFMGKSWDYDVPSKEMWASLLRTLKPGAHLLAFGGTRTYHRMVCAIEDAGFEIRDMAEWIYGTGFPKSVNLGEGMGSALKPAHEPICIARKPFSGSLTDNFSRWGTGGLGIEMSRIGRAEGDISGWSQTGSKASENIAMSGGNYARDPKPDAVGRFPANLIMDEDSAALLDATIGNRPGMSGGGKHRADADVGIFGAIDGNDSHIRSDNGGPSRFFYTAKASRSERDKGCEGLPMSTGGQATDREDGSIGLDNPRAGAGRTGGARNTHPTVKPLALCRWLAGLILPPPRGRPRTLCVPFAGVGSEMIGAAQAGWDQVLGIEMELSYVEVARLRIKAHFP